MWLYFKGIGLVGRKRYVRPPTKALRFQFDG